MKGGFINFLWRRNFSKEEMEESFLLMEAVESPWVFRKTAYS
jgi:hypothetical protein